MSSFSLVISPPDALQPGFTESTYVCATASLLERLNTQTNGNTNKVLCHTTLRYHALLRPKFRLMA